MTMRLFEAEDLPVGCTCELWGCSRIPDPDEPCPVHYADDAGDAIERAMDAHEDSELYDPCDSLDIGGRCLGSRG